MANQEQLKIERTEEIGKGGFGTVYRGKYEGRIVAIKDINGRLSAGCIAEAEMLKTFHHPHIIHYIDVITVSNKTSLIMEYVENGTLRDHIQKKRQTIGYWKDTRKIMLDVAYGMEYLHDKRVVHADLKSLNILLRNDNHAVICDFGLAKTMADSTTCITNHIKGSVRWLAPELCSENPERSSFSSDVWAFGCILLEIITKKFPWADKYSYEIVLVSTLSNRGNSAIFQDICSSQRAPSKLRDLLCRCCAWSKGDRPDFKSIIGDLVAISESDLKISNDTEKKEEQPSLPSNQPITTPRKRSEKKTVTLSKLENESNDSSNSTYESGRRSMKSFDEDDDGDRDDDSGSFPNSDDVFPTRPSFLGRRQSKPKKISGSARSSSTASNEKSMEMEELVRKWWKILNDQDQM